MIFGPAISSFELASIARGYFLLDQLVKKAAVTILEASAVSPGKFFILINGEEASIEESRKTLIEQSANQLLDEVYIPDIHPEVLPGMYSQNQFKVEESLGIVEATSIGSALLSADRACKTADVHLIDFRSARGIGGKAYYFVTGSLDNIQASVQTGTDVLTQRGALIRSEIVANPHEDFLKHFNVGGLP